MSRPSPLVNMLQAFERYDSDALPPPHRLVLVVLSDAQGRAWPDVKVVARRTGMSAQAVKAVMDDLRAAAWMDASPLVGLRSGADVRRGKVNPPPILLPRETEQVTGVSMRRSKDAHSAVKGREGPGAESPRAMVEQPDSHVGVFQDRKRSFHDQLTVPLTIQMLVAKRPGDDLLVVLQRGSENGHPWCVEALPRILERGGRLTEPERKALRKIRDESAHRRARNSATSSLQPMGNWRPKGASS